MRNNVLPCIHPELKAHTHLFKKKVHKIGDNVYSAVGWAPANTIMIEGVDGIILVDVGREIESAREVKKEFGKITKNPINASISCTYVYDIVWVAKNKEIIVSYLPFAL